MKKAKIAAAVVLAAAVSAASFAAACGSGSGAGVKVDGKKFNVDDYAHALDSAYSVNYRTDFADRNVFNAYSTVARKNFVEMNSLGNGLVDTVVSTKDSSTGTNKLTHTIYDIKNNRELFSGLSRIQPESAGRLDYYKIFTVQTGSSVLQGDTTSTDFRLMGPNGNLLINQSFPENTTLTVSQVRADYEGVNDIYYFKVSYKYVPVTSGTSTTTPKPVEGERYFSYSEDSKGNITINEVGETEANDSDYKAGKQIGVEKIKFDTDELTTTWDGFKFSVERGGTGFSTYTFYKDNEVTGSVVVEGDPFFVGNYLYYTSVVSVSSEAKDGYNYEYTEGDVTIKENHTLYRYNFVKGAKGVEEVKTDYIVTSVRGTMYNYSTQAIDRVVVKANKKIDGVVVDGENTKEYVLIMDDNFKVSMDISGKDLTTTKIFKLKEDRYLVGDYIIDGNFNTVSQLPYGATVWADKELILTYANGYGYLFVDFDGKVVVEPSSAMAVYGGAAYSASDKKVYSESNPAGKKLEDIVRIIEDEGETLTCVGGAIIKRSIVKATTAGGASTYTLTVYDLSGKSVGTISGLASIPSIREMSGRVVITGTIAGTTPEVATWIVG